MALKKELKNQSIVILANLFNPSIFKSHWLIKNKFLDESEIGNESVFAQQVCDVKSNNFEMLVTMDRLQLKTSYDIELSESILPKTLIPIIERLSEVPYTGIGINFDWLIGAENPLAMKDLNKKLFFKGDMELHNAFNKEDAFFGGYFSTDFEGTRLKLDVKPISEGKEMLFSFNYHVGNVTDYHQILKSIESWNEFKYHSKSIIELID